MKRRFCAALALILSASVPVQAIDPDDPGPADVQFTINAGQNVKAISPWIYGSNSTNIANRTFDRSGGNRMTGYNWENNASNAGADWYHHSDYGLVNNNPNAPPASAVRSMITNAATNGRASLITIPMAGYVAADGNGTVDETEIAPSSRWKQVVPKKSTIYPGSPLSTTPDKSDGYVFTDEYVHWAEDFKDPDQPLWFSLDNEPGLWGEALPNGWQSGDEPRPWENPPYPGVPASSGGRTHPTIHPYAPTFAEMRDKSIAHSSAIKDVNPNALVFGGVGYGWNEFTSMQDAPDKVTSPSHPGGDQSGEMHYNEFLLDEMRKADQQRFTPAELAAGKTLMDVLDLHWYPEARSGTNPNGGTRITENNNSTAVVAARVQAPRSLWDPTYVETSWISQWGTWQGSPGTMGPVKLLPRVQRDVDDFKPGTKIAITEYNYGGGNHISGAVAQADVLGIFGREGVFAASWWELDSGSSFVSAAFDMYRNFDGQGGTFGDTSVTAATSNIGNSAIYASTDSSDPNKMILVAINRTGTPLDAGLAVTSELRFDRAEVFQLTSRGAVPVPSDDILIDQVNAFHYTMPAFSVSTLVLHAVTALSGDFDADGDVDGRDFLVWQRDPSVGDLADWQGNYAAGITADLSNSIVPEPSGLVFLLTAAAVGIGCRATVCSRTTQVRCD
jgi:hypothetical protein